MYSDTYRKLILTGSALARLQRDRKFMLSYEYKELKLLREKFIIEYLIDIVNGKHS